MYMLKFRGSFMLRSGLDNIYTFEGAKFENIVTFVKMSA